MEKVNNRNNGLDLLRIISAVCVVLIHVNAMFYFDNAGTAEIPQILLIECFINTFTRFCVPVFIMISGMFNLSNPRNKDCLYFYRKSMRRICVPYAIVLFVWTAYYFVKAITGSGLLSFFNGFVQMSYGYTWFMPMLILLYLLTPNLVVLIENLNNRQMKISCVFLLIWAAGSSLFTDYKVPYALGVVISYLSYYILGYVLKSVYFNSTRQKILSALLLFAMLMATTWIRYCGFSFYEYDANRAFFSPVVICWSIWVFCCFNGMKLKNRFVLWIAGHKSRSYHVYLLHGFIIPIVSRFLINVTEYELLNMLVVFFVVLLTTVIVSVPYEIVCNYLQGRLFRKRVV